MKFAWAAVVLLVGAEASLARVTDTTVHLVNLSEVEDDAVVRWTDENAKLAVTGSLVHVAWQATPSDGGPRRLMYARSEDGGLTFSVPEMVADGSGSPAMGDTALTLAADGDNVYLLYVEGWPANIHLRRSLDGGVTWEPAELLHSAYNHSVGLYAAAQGDKVVLAMTLNMNDAPFTKSLWVTSSVNRGELRQIRELFSSTSVWRVHLQDLIYDGSTVAVLYAVADENYFTSASRLYLQTSVDDGDQFHTAHTVTVAAGNGAHYSPVTQDFAYSPNVAVCGSNVVVTWLNRDDMGAFDGWLGSTLRVRASADYGATLGDARTLHTFPTGYGNGSHAGQETVVCQGARVAVVATLNDGGERTRLWESTNGGGSFGAGRDVSPGGWWPRAVIHDDGTTEVLNGLYARVEPGGRLHAGASFLPSTMWDWRAPMASRDDDGVVHVAAQAATEFGDATSTDVLYRRLAPAPLPGDEDQALVLAHPDATRRDHLEVGSTAELSATGPFTVELWVKPQIGQDAAYTFVKKHLTGYGDTPGTFEIGSVSLAGVRYLRAGIATSPQTWLHVEDLPAGVWSHVALTFDPAASTGATRLYVDGVEVATGDAGGAVAADLLALKIGDDSQFGVGTVVLDDLMVWSEARSASDIAQDMGQGALGTEAGLVALWTFDGTGRDVSGHGHDGLGQYAETLVPSDRPRDGDPSDAGVVVDGGSGDDDGGPGEVPDAGPDEDHDDEPDGPSCSCDASAPGAAGAGVLLVALGMVVGRRRRRA